MADTTSNLISELDFETIKGNLSAYIANNSNFTDYNFEGSGLSFLTNILAYNTHYNSVYLNMAVNENFIDTAQLRSSVVSLAKNFGYTPKSKTSSLSNVTFRISEPNPAYYNGRTIYLEKTSKFTAEKGGTTFVFSPSETISATSVNGVYKFSDVILREGTHITTKFTSSGVSTEKFIVENFNVDLSTFNVVVQNSSVDTRSNTYEKLSDIKTIDGNSLIYYLFETTNLRYMVQFGDGILGAKPSAGNLVLITYQTSVGSASNNCTNFTFASTIDNRFLDSDLVFTNIVPSYGGSEEESIESIKLNALTNFRTQGRAVTIEDYKFFIGRDYPLADTISVWGGQDNDPPIYGKVFISFKPKFEFFLTAAEKKLVLDTIIRDKNIVSITPEIVDPEYTFIEVNSIVTFNSRITTLKANDIKSIVNARILEYNDTVLTKFGTELNYSKFITYIDDSDPAITGNITKLKMRKNIPVTVGVSLQYTINFQNAVHPESLYSKTPFNAIYDTTLGSTTADLYIDDDGLGNVRIYRFSGENLSDKLYLKNNTGTIDYESGRVVLNNFYPTTVNFDNTFDLIARPLDYSIGNIVSLRNNILTIIESDVSVDVRTA